MTTLNDIQRMIEAREIEFVSLIRGIPFSCWIVVKGVSGTLRGHGATAEEAFAAAAAQIPGSPRRPAVTAQLPGLPQARTRLPGLPT